MSSLSAAVFVCMVASSCEKMNDEFEEEDDDEEEDEDEEVEEDAEEED
jgi:hypothetical protein